jgi:hypothetical protein
VATLVFAHGISVRDERYPEVLPSLRKGIARIRPRVAVEFCFWGGTLGARLRQGGASIPGPGQVDELPAALPDDRVELWSMLEANPTLELRVLAESGGRPTAADVTSLAPMQQLEELAEALAHDTTLHPLLAEQGLAEAFPGAVAVVLDSAAARGALKSTVDLGDDLRWALARAFVATAMIRAGDEQGPAPLDGAHADRLVDAVVDRLGRADKGGRLLRLATELRLGRWAERRRVGISESVVPSLGDVAWYLSRGHELREHIAGVVAAARPPVYLLGHSLGGVASVDLLADRDLPGVELLITVGSQAPYLYELDALPCLRFGERLPARFPRWVNVYDERDMLAFVGGRPGLFPGHVTDLAVDNRAPFPRSHRAYFRNDRFYDLLDEVLP